MPIVKVHNELDNSLDRLLGLHQTLTWKSELTIEVAVYKGVVPISLRGYWPYELISVAFTVIVLVFVSRLMIFGGYPPLPRSSKV